MATHTFVTTSGLGEATGGTGGGSAGITGNVTINLPQDPPGMGINTAQSALITNPSATSASAATRFKIALGYFTSSDTVYATCFDDSSAQTVGPGGIANDSARIWLNGGSTTSFNDASGNTVGPNGSVGSYEWRQTDYFDGEGIPETRLDVRWNSVLVFSALVYAGQSSVVGSDGLTYTKGSQFSTTTNTVYYELTQGSPGIRFYQNTITSGALTHLKIKGPYSNVTPSGAVAPLRTINASAAFSGTSGTEDSGWIAVSNSAEVIVLDWRHLPATLTSDDSHTYNTSMTLEIWGRGSGVSDTKLRELAISAATTVAMDTE